MSTIIHPQVWFNHSMKHTESNAESAIVNFRHFLLYLTFFVTSLYFPVLARMVAEQIIARTIILQVVLCTCIYDCTWCLDADSESREDFRTLLCRPNLLWQLTLAFLPSSSIAPLLFLLGTLEKRPIVSELRQIFRCDDHEVCSKDCSILTDCSVLTHKWSGKHF